MAKPMQRLVFNSDRFEQVFENISKATCRHCSSWIFAIIGILSSFVGALSLKLENPLLIKIFCVASLTAAIGLLVMGILCLVIGFYQVTRVDSCKDGLEYNTTNGANSTFPNTTEIKYMPY